MLFFLFISSALLIGPSLQTSAVKSEHVEDSGRQSRQYWPGFVPNNPSLYQPWWSSYVPRYQPYHVPMQSPYHFGYPYGGYVKPKEPSLDEETVESLFNKFMNGEIDRNEEEEIESRQGGGINQAISNFPVIRNPNAPNYLNMYDGCKDPNGLSGVCLPSSLCRTTGGRASAGCGLTSVCCINAINTCNGRMSMNNTYWQSPTTVSAGNCDLTINLANNMFALFRPICQVRLEIKSLTLDQPKQVAVPAVATVSQCLTDTFTVRGASGTIPTICGKNDGQHMYLTPTDKKTNIVLRIAVATTPTATTVTRTWNIRIITLPCGANYLAPANCLQYFSQAAGSVMSFNYDDVSINPPTTRQLANQNYQICFRREMVNNQAATKTCFTPCKVNNAGKSFSISGDATAALNAATGSAGCPNDFLLIQAGFDIALNVVPPNQLFTQDRFCGTNLNPAGGAQVATVCTTVKDFNLYYKTDASEAGDTANVGFCLDFDERAN